MSQAVASLDLRPVMEHWYLFSNLPIARPIGIPKKADGDPYEDEYRRWVEATPDLPIGANALFKARAKPLDKGDADDAAHLRTELAKLGIVVREEKKCQFWRRTRASVEY